VRAVPEYPYHHQQQVFFYSYFAKKTCQFG
jgi:hypothetical protein